MEQNHALQSPELAIIIPTYNEKGNLHTIFQRLKEVLIGISWELIIVDDDSPDGTAHYARELAHNDLRVRCLHRIGRRGLSSACIEGILSTSARYVAVMDGDLQHDESILPKMFNSLKGDESIDLVVGSRHVEGGDSGGLSQVRARMSQFAAWLSRGIIRSKISDPMSGYFMIRRDVFQSTVYDLSSIGFKILVDILVSAKYPLRLVEIPYQFRNRHSGESKLDSQVVWDYFMLLGDKLVGRFIPVRFLSFSLIGSLGVVVHFLSLILAFKGLKMAFYSSQALATVIAMTSNYTLNNILTYSSNRLRGLSWFGGLISFFSVCSIGAITNVAVATYFYQLGIYWITAAFIGVIIGAIWNYALTSTYTWK